MKTFQLFIVVVLSYFWIGVNSELILPTNMKQDAYCDTCTAVAKALSDFKGNFEEDLFPKEFCSKENLKKYLTEMVALDDLQKTCKHLFDLYEEKIQMYAPGKNNIKMKVWLCFDETYACLGMSREKPDFSKSKLTEKQLAEDLMEMHKDRLRFIEPMTKRRDEL